ncbi:cell division ATP-binding protein FtsE [Kozakia baliensis]|uniref:cell division ATP-binding protein FtsE n=1 Tax=Kozakia baliensis TaxID=153496 RepID=UPI000497A2A5|nr:ATP-binding cassette domain-containing protein [Kozakia baliensis]AOX20148.1 cell division ATP-binding protein FtsE [Kozakia baliensis]
MIRLRDVCFSHHGHGDRARLTLRHLSLSVPQGGFRWLVGPSGAGKSSLLRLLHLSARPDHGTLEVLGLETQRAKRRQLAQLRQRIGMIHQDFRLLPDLSAFDNVALPLRLAGQAENSIQQETRDILEWLGLGAQAQARPDQLSGGERQRIAIARALVTRPALLLADEPTNALEESQAWRLLELFRDLSRNGTTVIVATHNETLLREAPAPAIILRQGALVNETDGMTA